MRILKKINPVFIFFMTLTPGSFAQNTWVKQTEHPAQQGLYGSCANVVNGKAYIAFGIHPDGTISKSNYEYDPKLNIWTIKQDFPSKSRYGCASFVIGDTIYYVGGSAGGPPYLDEVWAYSVTGNSWKQKGNFPLIRNLATAFTINGKGYIYGGTSTSPDIYLNELWEFNPGSNTWTQKAPIPSLNAERINPSVFVLNNKAYICGGRHLQTSYFDDTWEYDGATDNWVQKASRPAGLGTVTGAAFSLLDANNNQKGYYGLGINSSTTNQYPKTFYEYDLPTDQWTPIQDFAGTGRYALVSFVIANTAYLGLGSSDYITPTYEKDIWGLSFPVSSVPLSISGKIHQENTFLKNGQVVAHNVTYGTAFVTNTDTLGNFNFPSVTTGKYILDALPNKGERYNQTFYPNTTDLLKADTLTLGSSISEIDLYMNSSKTDSDSSESIFHEFNVYPNPCGNTLKVISSNKDIEFEKIHIMNITGGIQEEIFFNDTKNSCDLQMDHVEQGMYILQIETQNGTFLKKITKQ